MKRLKIKFLVVLVLLFCLSLPWGTGVTRIWADSYSAPTNFKAEVFQYYNQISWTNPEITAYYYTVIEKSIDLGPFIPITNLSKGTTSFRDYSVSNGHIYSYRARTQYGSNTSAYTNEIETVTLYPTNLIITRALHDQVDLEWSYPSLHIARTPQYELLIERRPTNVSTWTQIAALKSTETTYRDTTVSADTYYYYRIRARYTISNYSFYCPSDYGISTRTGFPLTTPLFGYAISNSQIRLEWDSLLLSEGQAILQKKNSAGVFTELLTSGYQNTYLDSGLTHGTTYTYRLMLRSKNGMNSEYTEEISIIPETVPAPTDITAESLTPNRIILSWSYPYDVETGFEVWRKSASEKWELLNTLPKNSENFTDTSASSGNSYTYIIRAIRGDSAFSSFSRSVSIINEYPPAPNPLVYWTSKNVLNLYSAEVVPSNATFTLEYRKDINDGWKDFSTADKGILIAHIVYTDATRFDFRIRADRGGLVSYGPELNFYGSAPDPSQNVTAVHVGYQRVLLTWDDVSAKEDGFNVYRTVNGKTEFLGQVGRNYETFEDKSPVKGSVTRYDITAYNISGESAARSTTVSVPNIVAYKDISLSHWAHDAVYTLQGLGAIDNSAAGYFYPHTTLSRSQAIRMLLKSFRIPYAPQGLFSFTDVFSNHAYYKDLMTSVSLGITFPDSQYRIFPDRAITRRELISLLNNTLNYLEKPLNTYDTDNLKQFSDYYQIAEDERHLVASFIGDGIVSGKSGRLALSDNLTKAECAVILYRTLRTYQIIK